ncbi:hypothetical protein [Promicromonospora iranensis]|uniref:hypothetical protein n=1 Tax=Promicromonospora iranensis TaxID=1105144 RepID=UPI0023A95158|nr:hypothetical protein [Promicromonospora iranensis]
MRNEQAVYRRVLRRETHASRTSAAVVTAVVVIVLLAGVIAVGVWWLAVPGDRDTIEGWFDSASALAGDRAALVTAGVVGLGIAVLLLALALLPGRLPRRARSTERVALLVDDGVLADAVADAVAARCGVDPRQVSATVGRRRTAVRVTPISGVPVDREAAADSAASAVAALGFSATPELTVARQGVVS